MKKEKQGKSILEKISIFEYPDFLLRFPKAIQLIYGINFIFQLRKWYVYPRIKHFLHSEKKGVWIDVGCGEGQYLIPISKQFSAWKVIGVDNNKSNISFLKSIIPANVELLLTNIETLTFENTANLITCIGVLQYIEEDEKNLKTIFKILLPGGKLLIYSPINGKLHFRLYEYLLKRYSNYETVNNRRRIYLQDELEQKLVNSGFRIESTVVTYGYPGRISHEIFNSLLLLITSANLALKIIALVLLITAIPVISILMIIDFCIKHSNGNGILITATR